MFVTRARLNYARMTEGNAETDVFFFQLKTYKLFCNVTRCQKTNKKMKKNISERTQKILWLVKKKTKQTEASGKHDLP